NSAGTRRVRRKIIGGRDHQPVREVAGDAEDDEGAGIGFRLCQSADRHRFYAFGPGFFGGSLCPPKPAPMAERIFSANVWSLRERKRAKCAAVNTSAGTASSIAALTVQRPSPESSTKPEYSASCGLSASAVEVRSSSQDGITLPRRHTSAMSARSKS